MSLSFSWNRSDQEKTKHAWLYGVWKVFSNVANTVFDSLRCPEIPVKMFEDEPPRAPQGFFFKDARMPSPFVFARFVDV